MFKRLKPRDFVTAFPPPTTEIYRIKLIDVKAAPNEPLG